MTAPLPNLRWRLAKLLTWPRLAEEQRFLLLSILIGIFSGLVVVCFHIAMEFVSWFMLETHQSLIRTLLSPAVGALAAVLLVSFVFRTARGSGVNDTKAAIYISDGYVPFSAVAGKFLACSVSIGSGNSLGPEDPSLHMGAGIASLLGRLFRLTRDRMRLIAPVGAAAGIAAAFNTPITAVLFVIEEVVAGWSAGVLGSIVLSAVSAVVVVRWFLGNEPLFLVPHFELTHPSELLVYALVGVVGGLLAVAFIRLVRDLRGRLSGMPHWMRYAGPFGAGLLVGVAGVFVPEVMGAGYGAIDNALHDRFSWNMLLVLGGLKIIVTLLCFGAGTPGGMFAPTLFTGAMVGGGIGGLAALYWPVPTSPPGAYVLVGMGTFFAGVFRAPMTSVFMVFEVSASYVIILPVMIANTVAYLVSRKLQPLPFFTLVARQEGLDLPSLEEQREAPTLHVEEAMSPSPACVFTVDTPVVKALDEMGRQAMWDCLVAEGRGVWSRVSRPELETAVQTGKGSEALGRAVPLEPLPRLYPDLALDSALRYLGSHPLLPVASRARPYRLVGVLTLEDVHRTYGIKPDGRGGAPT
jgi:CIC family chloride channel protein